MPVATRANESFQARTIEDHDAEAVMGSIARLLHDDLDDLEVGMSLDPVAYVVTNLCPARGIGGREDRHSVETGRDESPLPLAFLDLSQEAPPRSCSPCASSLVSHHHHANGREYGTSSREVPDRYPTGTMQPRLPIVGRP